MYTDPLTHGKTHTQTLDIYIRYKIYLKIHTRYTCIRGTRLKHLLRFCSIRIIIIFHYICRAFRKARRIRTHNKGSVYFVERDILFSREEITEVRNKKGRLYVLPKRLPSYLPTALFCATIFS